MAPSDELCSLVTPEGAPLGGERRSVCHKRPDLLHASAAVMVFDSKNRLFLQKRSKSKDVEPGKWDTSCAGHCRPGEGFEAAARREMEEELGVRPGRLVPFWRRIGGTADETELTQTFITWSDGPFDLDGEEASEGRFWERGEFLAALGTGAFTPHLEEEGRRWFLGREWPKALAVDLDGTALGPGGELAPETVRALAVARERGVRVFLATARPPRSARPFVEAMGLDEAVVYYNGALAAEPDGRVLWHRPLDAGAVRSMTRAFRQAEPDCDITYESLDKWLTDRPPKDFITATAAKFAPDEVGDLESFLDRPITKMLASVPGGEVAGLARLAAERFADRAVAWPTDGGRLLQVMQPGADKGAALRALLAARGLNPADLLAVGDDMNDADMLRMAGRSVAMGNAPVALKALADDVAPPTGCLGLAKTVEKYILSVPEKMQKEEGRRKN